MKIKLPNKIEHLKVGQVVALGYLLEHFDTGKLNQKYVNTILSNYTGLSKNLLGKINRTTGQKILESAKRMASELSVYYAQVMTLKLHSKELKIGRKKYKFGGDDLPAFLWWTTLDGEVARFKTHKYAYSEWKYLHIILARMFWSPSENMFTTDVTGDTIVDENYIHEKAILFCDKLKATDALKCYAFFLHTQTDYSSLITSRLKEAEMQASKEKNTLKSGDGEPTSKTSSVRIIGK